MSAEGARLGALLLDLDGTLVDSHPALRATYRRFVSAHGGTPSDDEYQRWNGPPLAEIVAGLQAAHAIAGDPRGLYEEYVRLLEGSYRSETRLAEGADALLAGAERSRLACALVTSAPARLARPLLERLGVRHRFAVIVCGDEIARGKPAADGYLAALAQLDLAPERCLAAEDTAAGVSAARGAGLRAIGVGPERDALLRAGALVVVTGLHELSAIATALAAGAPGRVVPARTLDVRFAGQDPPLAPELVTLVDDRWSTALRTRPALTDDEIATVHGFEDAGDGSLRVTAGLAPYRRYIAQRDGVPLGLRALGVTAVTLLHGAPGGPHLVLGRRSRAVTQYPGCWELVPSGSVTRQRVGGDGAIDATAQLLQELDEELGLPASRVRAITALGLVEDLGDRVVDLAYRLDAAGTLDELSARAPGAELGAFAHVPLAVLLADRSALARATRGGPLVPTLAPIVELLAARVAGTD